MHLAYLFVSFFCFIGTYIAVWAHDLYSFAVFFVSSCVAWRLAQRRAALSAATNNE